MPLRKHLLKVHKEEYFRTCEQNGWPIPGEENNDPAPAAGVFHAKFTQQVFMGHLVNFIVADDQVCLDLIYMVNLTMTPVHKCHQMP